MHKEERSRGPEGSPPPPASSGPEQYKGIPPVSELQGRVSGSIAKTEALFKTAGSPFEAQALDDRLRVAERVAIFLRDDVEARGVPSQDLMRFIGSEEQRWKEILSKSRSDLEKRKAQGRLDVLGHTRHLVADAMANREPFANLSARQETPAKRPAEINAVPETERRLIENVLQAGGVSMFSSLPREYHPSGGAGFAEKGVANRIDPKNQQAAAVLRELGLTNRDKEDGLREAGVHEVVGLRPMERSASKTIEVPASGWRGALGRTEKRTVPDGKRPVTIGEVIQGGSQEPAWRFMYATLDSIDSRSYRDYSGRPGQVLAVDIAMPESVARELQSAIDKDPSLARKIVERAILEKMSIPRDAWEDGNESTNDYPLKPPYEKWAKKGESKVYVVPPSQEAGIDPSRIKTVKSGR